jgi:hypothetical protein
MNENIHEPSFLTYVVKSEQSFKKYELSSHYR